MKQTSQLGYNGGGPECLGRRARSREKGEQIKRGRSLSFSTNRGLRRTLRGRGALHLAVTILITKFRSMISRGRICLLFYLVLAAVLFY